MLGLEELKNIVIDPKSQKMVQQLLDENPRLGTILEKSASVDQVVSALRQWAMEILEDRPHALAYYKGELTGRKAFEALTWHDYAVIRILDYADLGGRMLEDLNLHGKLIVNHPFALLWYAAAQGTGGATPPFFEDMIQLFRQLAGRALQVLPDHNRVLEWMARYPTGLDPEIVKVREKNRDRILSIIIRKLTEGEIRSPKYIFPPEVTDDEKYRIALSWWEDKNFHLRFAVRTPGMLNEMLGFSLCFYGRGFPAGAHRQTASGPERHRRFAVLHVYLQRVSGKQP